MELIIWYVSAAEQPVPVKAVEIHSNQSKSKHYSNWIEREFTFDTVGIQLKQQLVLQLDCGWIYIIDTVGIQPMQQLVLQLD